MKGKNEFWYSAKQDKVVTGIDGCDRSVCEVLGADGKWHEYTQWNTRSTGNA
jgi:hypothetical protein